MKQLIIFFYCFLLIYLDKETRYLLEKTSSHIQKKIEYKTDTIVIKIPNDRNILIGDAILTETKNQQEAKEYGLFFEKIEVSVCGESEYQRPNKILNIREIMVSC